MLLPRASRMLWLARQQAQYTEIFQLIAMGTITLQTRLDNLQHTKTFSTCIIFESNLWQTSVEL